MFLLEQANTPPIAKTIIEALLWALIDYWYVWLLMAAIGVGLAMLNDWSRRVEARRRAERRARNRFR